MLYVDSAESYQNDQHNAIQSPYFGNQCLRTFTVCCYAKCPNNNDVRNDNVIVVTKSSNHDRFASMSCLQKVVHKIEHMHEKDTRIFKFGVMEWCPNLHLAIYSNY